MPADKLSSLIRGIEKQFYNKKKNILIEFEKLEERKRIKYDQVRANMAQLKSKEIKLNLLIRKLSNELKLINLKLKALRKDKIIDEVKLRELK